MAEERKLENIYEGKKRDSVSLSALKRKQKKLIENSKTYLMKFISSSKTTKNYCLPSEGKQF